MGLLSNIISGLSLGSIYALIALGYTMVYGIAKMLNFAHGDVIMAGAYSMIVFVATLGLPPLLSVLLGILFCVILGVTIEKVAYKPLRKASPLSVLITAIGVSYLLQNIALITFGSDKRSFPNILNIDPIRIGTLTIKGESVATLLVTGAIMAFLTLYIARSKSGKAMRAVSEDKDAAELMGISVNRTISITFAIGSGLAAVAGFFYAATYIYIGPYTGSMPGIKAFVAAVFGGIGSIPGAMLGGVLLGIIENLSKAYISTELSDAIVFGVLILVLVIRPTGLLGKKISEKV
ncbi:MAG: branched-chain amino acid ABC transporter permease [Christensenellales bacterium]|jgi:branched-chain amino acid transport system permease protein